MSRLILDIPVKGKHLIGGVVFTDGISDKDVGPNLTAYFLAHGAHLAPVNAPAEVTEPLTVAELKRQADDLGIEYPAQARKSDLVDLIEGYEPEEQDGN
jgi:hypothetical protein